MNELQLLTDDWIRFDPFMEEVKHLVSRGSMRQLLRSRKTNGASLFVRRLPKYLLLSPKLFYKWVETQGS